MTAWGLRFESLLDPPQMFDAAPSADSVAARGQGSTPGLYRGPNKWEPMSSSEEDTLVVYSDYVCPFCYLGKRSLESYLEDAENPPSIEWRAFDLRGHKRGPDDEIRREIEDGKDEAYMQRARRNVERLAKAYDVEMNWDIDQTVDAWDAHKLAIYARREHGGDVFEELNEAIFTALWRDNRDISETDVLVDLAGKVGLSEEETRQAIDSEELDETLRDQFARSHRAGVTGVPTFAYGDLQVPGAVPAEDIAKIVANG